jgi:hypothetical protein
VSLSEREGSRKQTTDIKDPDRGFPFLKNGLWIVKQNGAKHVVGQRTTVRRWIRLMTYPLFF